VNPLKVVPAASVVCSTHEGSRSPFLAKSVRLFVRLLVNLLFVYSNIKSFSKYCSRQSRGPYHACCCCYCCVVFVDVLVAVVVWCLLLCLLLLLCGVCCCACCYCCVVFVAVLVVCLFVCLFVGAHYCFPFSLAYYLLINTESNF